MHAFLLAPSHAYSSASPAEEVTKNYYDSSLLTPPVFLRENRVTTTSQTAGMVDGNVALAQERVSDHAKQQDSLYAEFRPLVRRLIRQYGENAEIRKDLEGEIYYRFCTLLNAYDPTRGVPLRPYLVRQLSASVYTYVRHHWRNQHREVSLELFASETEPSQSEDPTSEWDNALNLQQVKKTLPEAISKLSDRQRKVVIWRYYEDCSFDEIAERLGVQVATARSLLRHGLNHLRGVMMVARTEA